MKQKIVFFDIDGVIFDAKKFAESFYQSLQDRFNLSLSDIQNIRIIYQEVRNEKGFFDPEVFLTKISKSFSISKEDLERLWWDDENFLKHLLISRNFLEKIQKKAVIGIFSKGQMEFQTRKLEVFYDLIDKSHRHIFENKISKIQDVLDKYKDYKIYVIDDSQEVLNNFKKINSNVVTVFISSNTGEQNSFIDFSYPIQDFLNNFISVLE